MIWSQEILSYDSSPNDYYVHTEYISFESNAAIDYSGSDMFSILAAQTTPTYSVSDTTTYSNGVSVSAYLYASFMFDGANSPSVNVCGYGVSDSTYFSDMVFNETHTSTSCTLKYKYKVKNFLKTWVDGSVSLICNKNGIVS